MHTAQPLCLCRSSFSVFLSRCELLKSSNLGSSITEFSGPGMVPGIWWVPSKKFTQQMRGWMDGWKDGCLKKSLDFIIYAPRGWEREQEILAKTQSEWYVHPLFPTAC